MGKLKYVTSVNDFDIYTHDTKWLSPPQYEVRRAGRGDPMDFNALGPLVKIFPSETYHTKKVMQWCRDHAKDDEEQLDQSKGVSLRDVSEQVRGETQRVGKPFQPPLSEEEQEKYRAADEKLRQSDWFQLSKQEQADWQRGVDYETKQYEEQAEKEQKIRADAEMPYLMIIAILVFVVAPLYFFPDPGFVLGWVCVIGLLGTLFWIYDRTT